MKHRAFLAVVIVACLGLLGLLPMAFGPSKAPPRAPSTVATPAVTDVALPDDRPIERLVTDRSPAYVSSTACQECHAQEYHTWHASYHRTMTQVASGESVVGDFANRTARAYGEQFRLSKRGDGYWVDLPDRQRPGERIEREVALTTGSHHMQIYWYPSGEGRALSQLPVAWLIEDQQWVPTSSLFISPPPQPWKEGRGRWNEICIRCHTTAGRPHLGDMTRATHDWSQTDTSVAEFGISCEACHGAAGEHVAYHRAQQPVSNPELVHPGNVAHRAAAQLCGQCHGIWLEDSEEKYLATFERGRSFVPGADLASCGHIFGVSTEPSAFIKQFLSERPNYLLDRFWSDGMPRVSGSEYNSLARSDCFQQGTLTCISCHAMHPSEETDLTEWADDQLAASMRTSEACLGCHTTFREAAKLTAHTHHTPTSSGSACTNCHMPYTTYGLLKAIRSHEISSPRAGAALATGRPLACNQCHLDQTLAWSAEHLADWYDHDRPELSQDQQRTSATALACLAGDAGQRALAAWSLGWKPAQAVTARDDWMVPLLAQLLTDPYDAVRYIAARSLRTLPDYRGLDYDFTASEAERAQVAAGVFRSWQTRQAAGGESRPNEALLLGPRGTMLRATFRRLLQARDNRAVFLAE